MKKLLVVLIIALSARQSEAQFSHATLQATGLTCAMCSNAINKALQVVPFVESVRSDIKNSAFKIVFKKGEKVNMDALKDAVEDAGFSIGSLKITGEFEQVKIGKDEHVKIGDANFHFLNVSSQVLDGEQTFTIVDKHFVTDKAFKKWESSSKKKCVQNGKAADCCVKEGITAGERVYHVTI